MASCMECTAQIITLRVEAGIISKILDRNQVFVPVLEILRLAGFITLRVERESFPRCALQGALLRLA